MHQTRHARHQLVRAILATAAFCATPTYANIYGPGNHFGPISTSTQPNSNNIIELLPSGQILGAADNNAINLDTIHGQVIIDPYNFFSGADAVTTTGLGIGINITEPGSVSVGFGSGVRTLNPVALSGASAIVSNITPAPSGSALIFSNAGIIQTLNNNFDTIHVTNYFTQLNNTFGGQILNLTSPNPQNNITLLTATGIGGGNIINDVGSYNNNANLGDNIFAQDTVMNNIVNKGFLNSTGNGILSNPNAISNTFNNIINQGFISSSTMLIPGNCIELDSASSSITTTANALINTGTLLGFNNGIFVDDFVTITQGIFNAGDILVPSATTSIAVNINGSASYFQGSGLVLGDINYGSGQQSPSANTVLALSGGVISGDFTAPSTGSNVMNITGGSLTGSLLLEAPTNTVNMSGGFVNNFQSQSNTTSTLNLSGGRFNTIDGNNAASSRTTTVNINSSMTSGVIQYVNNINVQNENTVLNLPAPIIFDRATPNFASTMTINAPTTVLLQAPILSDPTLPTASTTASILNNGTLKVIGNQAILFSDYIQGTGARVINDNYLGIDSNSSLLLTLYDNNSLSMGSDGQFAMGINGQMGGVVDYGRIVVHSQNPTGSLVNFTSDSEITPYFQGFLPQGTQMTILTLNSATDAPIITTDNSTLVPQPSAVVQFMKQLSAYKQDIILTVNRNPYSNFSTSGATNGVSQTLNTLALGNGPTNPDLFYLLSQLDQLIAPPQVEQAMESLTPPSNNGIPSGSYLAMKTVFETINDRIWDFAWPYRFEQSSRPHEYPWDIFGFNAGDWTRNMNVWMSPIGIYANQGGRHNIAGYKVYGAGGVLGVDWAINRCIVLGGVGSYFKENVKDHNLYPKNEAIHSWQGSLYGSFEFVYGMYLDAIVGAAHNHYNLNRVIGVNDLFTAAQSAFSGWQWGGQADLGMVLPTGNSIMWAPFLRYEYLGLHLDGYQEVGANDLNLAVDKSHGKNMMAGLGLQIATSVTYFCCDIIPEASILLGYDFVQTTVQSLASFLGGGPAFNTPNALPRRTLWDFSLGINVLTANQSAMTAEYNGELRSGYYANAGTLQYTFKWG